MARTGKPATPSPFPGGAGRCRSSRSSRVRYLGPGARRPAIPRSRARSGRTGFSYSEVTDIDWREIADSLSARLFRELIGLRLGYRGEMCR